MPSSEGYKRDYKQEYKTAKKRGEVGTGSNGENAQRKRARRKLEREGKVSKGDGKDVAHLNNRTSDNSSSNLVAQSKSKNRSFARNKNAGRKK